MDSWRERKVVDRGAERHEERDGGRHRTNQKPQQETDRRSPNCMEGTTLTVLRSFSRRIFSCICRRKRTRLSTAGEAERTASIHHQETSTPDPRCQDRKPANTDFMQAVCTSF